MINRGQHFGIGIIEQVLEPSLCDTVVEYFDRSDKKGTGEVVRPDGSRAQGKSKVSIDLDIAEFPKELRDQIHYHIVMAFVEYQNQFPSLQGLEFRTMGYMIQMYPKNQGRFDWHSDATNLETFRRQVAMVLYLNDVAEGGETEFHYQELRVAPRRGNCIFFPPFWTHRHRGTVPVSDDKYVITSFFERDFDAE